MKEGIHPDYHEITVKLTDGSSFKTFSTWGKEGDTLQLDTDITTHNAWVGGKSKLNENAGNVAKFNQKFGGVNFANLGGKKSEEPKEDKSEEKPAE